MVVVRKAEKKDLEQIKKTATMAWYDVYQNLRAASTIVQFLEAAYSEERIQKRMDDSLFLVAEQAGEVVGFANFINGRELYLAAIYVKPGYQRNHAGGELLEAGLKHFPDYDELFVEVASDNATARGFYDKEQFERVREYKEELFGEQVTTALLKKRLK